MRNIYLFILLFTCFIAEGQDLEPFELNDSWLTKIEGLAPEKLYNSKESEKRILVFSLYTGFEHWAIPHTEAVINIIATKSGIASCNNSKDIFDFEVEKLKQYDAIVLNNTCPERDKRDIFYDIFRKDSALSESERWQKARELEANLINYVAEGGGLILLHGGTTMQNNSIAFSEMTGGSFDFHPKQQPLHVELADPDHLLTQSFSKNGFTHTDELYFFKNAYSQKNFHPLLFVNASKVIGMEQPVPEPIRYVSWIKSFGKGKVFVCTPSHNAQSFENPELLQFILNGIRYALGDLEVNDDPLQEK